MKYILYYSLLTYYTINGTYRDCVTSVLSKLTVSAMYRTLFTTVLINVINFIFGISILALIIRFLLRLLGANPASGFTQFIYNSTNPLLDPFRNIFSPYVLDPGNVIEFSTLLAIIAYALIAYLLVELISYIGYLARRTYYATTNDTTP